MSEKEKCCEHIAHDCHAGKGCRIAERLEARQKPQRTWVGLTDEDLRKLADKHLFYQSEGYEVSGVFALARDIEAALRSKNT